MEHGELLQSSPPADVEGGPRSTLLAKKQVAEL